MVKKLELHFSKPFEADIWEQSISGNSLLLTTRDAEAMNVSFSLVDLSDGRLVFEGLAFEEDWWVSVYHYFGEVALFQVYEDTQDIEARNYFAMDLKSQEAIWSLDAVKGLGRQGHFVQMKPREEESESFWVDIRSGEVHDNLPEEIVGNDISFQTRYPLHYTEEGTYFQTVRQFLAKRHGIEIVKACDYLEYKDYAFIAYHQQAGESLEHFLSVISPQGELILHQKRDSGLKGLVSGAFFIAEEQLIFVEGRKTLKSYLIA